MLYTMLLINVQKSSINKGGKHRKYVMQHISLFLTMQYINQEDSRPIYICFTQCLQLLPKNSIFPDEFLWGSSLQYDLPHHGHIVIIDRVTGNIGYLQVKSDTTLLGSSKSP